MSIRHRTVVTLFAALVAAGCATAGKVGKVDAPTLWQQGMDKLQAGKWTDAARIFERFTLEFPTDPRYQEARFRVGEAHFGGKEYITAATEFARLASDYPGGPFADDAQFKVCESYQRLSPEIELDQQYTQAAIDQCQVLLAYFPGSEFLARGATILSDMTDKLAHKAFWTGDYYLRRKAYDPAIMYYELTVRTWPGSAFAPRALARMIEAYRILGYDTEEAATRARLLKDYPESAEAKQKPDSVVRR